MRSALTTSAPSLDIDAATVRSALGNAPFGFRHRLGRQPFLTLPAIAAVADAWPPDALEHHVADDLPLLLPTGATEQLPLGAGDVVRGLDTNRCWVALWFLENIEVFGQLLDAGLDPLADLIGRREGGIRVRGLNALVASPHAVVPAHFDLHHNLLLQIEGTKEVMVGAYTDPEVAQREFRNHFEGGTNNVRRLPEHVTCFRLEPGEGVYIPPYGIHWVRGGEETSVSVSFGFRTERSIRTELSYVCNANLRKLGLSPAEPGKSELRDGAKAAVVRSKRQLDRALTSARRRARRLVG